jgi:hypothetical protein
MKENLWPISPRGRLPNLIAVYVLLLLLMGGCSSERYLRTEVADPGKITGEFTVILYGARYAADMQNVALLDKKGDQYSFGVYAPEFDYKVIKNLEAEDAIAQAERHTSWHYAYWRTEWRSVQDFEGNTIGFEARPLYSPLDAGYPDIFDISYTIKDYIVTARIRLKPGMEKSLLEEEADSPFRMRR